MTKIVNTTKAPAAIGPYSQGVVCGNLVFSSGQLGIDPQTGDLKNGISDQAKQSMDNLKAVLESAGSSLDKILKTTIFLKDLADFGTVNEIYASYFKGAFPARSCVQVAKLPKDGLVEIEAVAYL